ncbi:MAG: hypothetical protein PHT15_08805, partial [Gallionellaceae bacterium]|nr:hypothetical protein [Gallionellaceae bacterium]
LPPTVKKETLDLLRKYVDVRVQASQITLADKVSREPLLREASQIRTKLWSLAIQSAKDDDRVTTSGLYIQALGGLIDSYTARDEVLNRHIPEIVIISLLLTFILAGGVLGYTSGAAGHRPTTPVFLFVAISFCGHSSHYSFHNHRPGPTASRIHSGYPKEYAGATARG